MDIETASGGAGVGGLIGAVATWFGIRQRVDSMQRSLDDAKDAAVLKETCLAHRAGNKEQMEGLHKKLDYIVSRVDKEAQQ